MCKQIKPSVFVVKTRERRVLFMSNVKKWLLRQKKVVIYAKVYLKFLFLHVK